jgi:hypothetical protein
MRVSGTLIAGSHGWGYDVETPMSEENSMSADEDKKGARGRSRDQLTKDGTSSAGSMGVGGSGDSGKLSGGGSRQSAGRTDDLLDDGTSQTGDKGFSSGGPKVETGLEGMGKQGGGAQGNRQSGQQGHARRQGDRANEGQRNR